MFYRLEYLLDPQFQAHGHYTLHVCPAAGKEAPHLWVGPIIFGVGPQLIRRVLLRVYAEGEQDYFLARQTFVTQPALELLHARAQHCGAEGGAVGVKGVSFLQRAERGYVKERPCQQPGDENLTRITAFRVSRLVQDYRLKLRFRESLIQSGADNDGRSPQAVAEGVQPFFFSTDHRCPEPVPLL
ncbi:MAG TPA: hypothetical protein VFR55_04810 [Dehalococcoidia bacterium]|nr:hypothetical protein [Dehalococcoidia bacterium]